MDSRINHIALIVGMRGTGKTTLGKDLIQASPLKKILVIDTFEHPSYNEFQTIKSDMLSRWKAGKKRILFREEYDMACVNEYVRNTCIVMEDCTKYLTGDLSKAIKGILFDSKQKNNDVIIMYHGFSFIPPKILANCNSITLFKIGENIENYKNKIPNYESVLAAHKKVQASKNIYERKTIMVN